MNAGSVSAARGADSNALFEGFGSDSERQRKPLVMRDPTDLQVVAVRRVGVIALEGGLVNVVCDIPAVGTQMSAGRVDSRPQSAFFEFGFHSVHVPW